LAATPAERQCRAASSDIQRWRGNGLYAAPSHYSLTCGAVIWFILVAHAGGFSSWFMDLVAARGATCRALRFPLHHARGLNV
jgi:hypothetical protein